jgi:hypothetical protein
VHARDLRFLFHIIFLINTQGVDPNINIVVGIAEAEERRFEVVSYIKGS